jgi:hypothetical protein
MTPTEPRGKLSVIYGEAAERLKIVSGQAAERVQDAMSATPGWQAAAKAAAAHAVLVATRTETEAQVEKILEAYVESGERNPEEVARDVREKFLSGLSAPGLEFFESAAAEAAALKPVALRHAAEFESWRDALAAGLVDRFRRAQAAHESTIPLVAARAETYTPLKVVLLAFLVVTAVLSFCGLSWPDLVRKALAR